MGVFKSGTNYVWNASYRDKIIYKIGGVYYNFLVRNYGASVTAAPTSVNGDSNWEAMQKFVNIATDTFFPQEPIYADSCSHIRARMPMAYLLVI